MNWTSRLAKVALLTLIVYSGNLSTNALAFGPASPERQAHDIGVEAYEYAYPLVLLGLTRSMEQSADDKNASSSGAASNKFSHRRQLTASGDHKIVRPNNDVLYSTAWIDVSKEPVVVTAPDTEDRYYFLTMLDGWSEAFASPGKRATGTQPGNFAIVGPRWKGSLPAGVTRYNSGTNYVWIVGRMEVTNQAGQRDLKALATVQNGFKISPLSAFITSSGGAENSSESTSTSNNQNVRESKRLTVTAQSPAQQVADMNAERFFSIFSELLFSNPPHKEDVAIVNKLKVIGIEPGMEFRFDKLSPEIATALENAVIDAKAVIGERAKTISVNENGWSIERKIAGSYGTNYLDRAAVAMLGAGLNRLDDAVYPSCSVDAQGQPLSGGNRYLIHFDKAQLPQVKAFWSIALYDSQGYSVANSLDRVSLSDRDPLKYNADGSLDIYVQHDDPGADKQSNWLPAPASSATNSSDQFNLLMRLYWPKTTVLSGAWVPPLVNKVN